jgi:AmmeMemoRadiSam system protein B
LALDHATLAELEATKAFDSLSAFHDEQEHSLEMHLPFIYKVLFDAFGKREFPPLVPLLVGSTGVEAERKFGRILAPYLADEGTFFVISSDFCHWGTRFRYTYYLPKTGPAITSLKATPKTGAPISDSIERVDRQCMDACETGSHVAWTKVLEETGNTVCGRHPIGVMMAAVEEWRGKETAREGKGAFRFVRYERSSLVSRITDSSVSYCSAVAIF